jgi:hypothetical protein
MATPPTIDPQYAAEFQRGYDPAVHAPLPEPVGPAPIEAPEAPVAQRVMDAPLAAAGPAAAHTVEVTAQPSEEPRGQRTPRTEWALLGVGILMLLLAVWLFSRTVELTTSTTGAGPSVGEQAFALAADALPGPLLLAGVVAIALCLALQAVRPRPVKRRWIVGLAALATLIAGVTVAAAARSLLPRFSSGSFTAETTDSAAEWEAFRVWLDSGHPYGSMLPWLASAALLTAVAALALAARRAQLASTVATASQGRRSPEDSRTLSREPRE